MKRQRLLRHLREQGCTVVREGGDHTHVMNPANRRLSSVPRHREIKPNTVRTICKQLDIPVPAER